MVRKSWPMANEQVGDDCQASAERARLNRVHLGAEEPREGPDAERVRDDKHARDGQKADRRAWGPKP